jgi:short-subunit dehydrogenase
MNMQNETYTLITGGSEGIGRALAEDCAKRGMNILLVALPAPQLEKTAQYIRDTYHVKTEYLGVDLTQANAPYEVHDWTQQKGYAVDVLINNAGFGYAGAFAEYASPEFFDKLMQLNMRALVLLNRLFIPELQKHPKAYLMNLGSMSSFQPVPYQAVYGASKAFIYNFTRALRTELAHSNISVTVMCPGGTNTNPINKARNEDLKGLAKRSILNPEDIAPKAINAMLKGKAQVVTGRINRIILAISKLIPLGTRLKIAAKNLKPKQDFNKTQDASQKADVTV